MGTFFEWPALETEPDLVCAECLNAIYEALRELDEAE